MRTVDSEVRARGGSVSIGIDICGTKCALSVGRGAVARDSKSGISRVE